MTEYRLQVRGERWKQKDGLSPNPKKMDSPPTPLQERGIVTTGERGLSVLAITEHPLSPPETGASTTQWGGGG